MASDTVFPTVNILELWTLPTDSLAASDGTSAFYSSIASTTDMTTTAVLTTQPDTLIDQVHDLLTNSTENGTSIIDGIAGVGDNAGDLILNDSLINLNVTNTEDFVVIYTAAAVFLFILISGIILVNLFIVVLIKGHKTFAEFPFFTIVWQVIIVNEVHMITQVTTILPLMFIPGDDLDPVIFWWNRGGGIAIHFSEEGLNYFTLLMALNRFSIFVLPRIAFVFEKSRIKWIIIVTWMVVLIIVIARFSLGLTRSFDKENMSFDDVLQASNTAISLFFNVLSFIIPLINFSIYIVIYIVIRSKRSMNKSRVATRNDITLLKEAFAISVTLEFTKLTTTAIPIVMPYVIAVWLQWVLKIFGNAQTIFNHVINSLLFLSTNRTVRRVLYSLFGKELPLEQKTTETSQTPIRVVGSNNTGGDLRSSTRFTAEDLAVSDTKRRALSSPAQVG